MLEHRFREQLAQIQPAFVGVATGGFDAFMPCPMFHSLTATHQTQIQDIYRIAAERTREQLRQRRPGRLRLPQFSQN